MSEPVAIEPPGLWIRLSVAAVLAVVLYAVAMPQTAEVLYHRAGSPQDYTTPDPAQPTEDDPQNQADPQPALKLGRLDAPPVQTIAFIGHEDFEELVARQSKVTQAALQDAADPTPDAPDNVLDPTPPSPTAAPTAPTPPTPSEPPPTPTLPQPNTTPRPPLPPAPLVAETPPPPPGDLAVTVASPPAPPVPPAPKKPAPPTPATDPNPDLVEPTTKSPDPTSAPRTDAESPPVTIQVTDLEKKANNVFVGQGFELITKRPERVNSAIFAARGVAIFDIHFNAEGRVDNVVTLQSSGYADIDEALITSVYRYRLRGDLLEEADRVTIERFGIRY
ncbi:MAG: hypothetical protein AAF750_08145 [Planctomycetota bacterium]